MIASVLINYLSALAIDRLHGINNKKIILIVSIVLNLSLLGYYKYYGFFTQNINNVFGEIIPVTDIVLPIGISFLHFRQ